MIKKGQLSFFALIGLILILAIILYVVVSKFLLETPLQRGQEELAESSIDQPIKVFIESCVTQTSRLGLFFFGFVGGDVTPQAYQNFFSYGARYKIPYLYYGGISTDLTKEFVQTTLAKYVDDNLKKCTGSFVPFPGVNIKDREPKTNVNLLDNEIVFSVNYPITVTRDNKKSVIGPEFTSKTALRLEEMRQITNQIISQKKSDPSLIHWNYLTDVTQKGYNATAYAEVDSTLIYRIVDERYELLGEPYIFQFAVKLK